MIATYFKGWQGSHTYYHMTQQVQNRVDILLSKYRGDILQLVQNQLNILSSKSLVDILQLVQKSIFCC